MTTREYRELKEASDELLSFAEMLRDTVRAASTDLDQLASDQNLVQQGSRRVYWAIESILQED
jgi:hypothetical protein